MEKCRLAFKELVDSSHLKNSLLHNAERTLEEEQTTSRLLAEQLREAQERLDHSAKKLQELELRCEADRNSQLQLLKTKEELALENEELRGFQIKYLQENNAKYEGLEQHMKQAVTQYEGEIAELQKLVSSMQAHKLTRDASVQCSNESIEAAAEPLVEESTKAIPSMVQRPTMHRQTSLLNTPSEELGITSATLEVLNAEKTEPSEVEEKHRNKGGSNKGSDSTAGHELPSPARQDVEMTEQPRSSRTVPSTKGKRKARTRTEPHIPQTLKADKK